MAERLEDGPVDDAPMLSYSCQPAQSQHQACYAVGCGCWCHRLPFNERPGR